MIKLYPDRPVAAAVRVFADLMATGWTVAWAVLGFLIYQTIMGLEVIASGISSTGTTFNSWIKQFHDAIPGGIPGVTDFLLKVADALRKYSGDPLVSAGHQVLLPYGAWRWRDMREIGSALAFVRIASVTGRAEQARAVLAYRAVSTLTFRQLMSASADPVGDIAERRYERLAAEMMKRAGLDPGRLSPPRLPELPGHRGR